jgi:pentatricopeptide repeat protein
LYAQLKSTTYALLSRSGNAQAALDLLRGMTNDCTLDLITYNTVISNIAKTGKIAEALDLLHVM